MNSGRTIGAAGAAVLAVFIGFAAVELYAGPPKSGSAFQLLPQKKNQVKAKRKAAKFHRLNLNTAADSQLAVLKGVTPDLAKKIVGARFYRSVDELTKAGLDAQAINAIRPFVTVGGWGGKYRKPAYRLKPGEKVNLNTAEQKVIEALPGIGRAKAGAIIGSRPYSRPEDVMKVRGIKAKTFARIKNLILVK